MIPRTLRGKFTIVYIVLAFLALLVGFAGIWNLFRLEQSIDNLMTANYKSINAVSHMMESIERQDSGMLIYMNVDKGKGIDIFTSYGNEFIQWFDIERGNVTETGELDVIGQLQADYSQYQKMMFGLQGSMNNGMESAQDYYSAVMLPMIEKIKAECRQLIAINEQAMFSSKQRIIENTKQSMFLLLFVTMAVVAGGYLIARYFIILFLHPIKKLSDSIVRVRDGDLSQQVEVSSNDEAGRLATEFNSMTRRLQEYEQSSLGTLMAEKQKSLAIVRSIMDPLLVMDANWRILLINDACSRFFGLNEDSVAGLHFLEVIHDGELFRIIEQLSSREGGTGGKIIRIEREVEYFFNLTVTKVNDPDSRNAGIIVALQNVTGLKEIERVRANFLAAVSHEFKTPLTSIMMAASMLHEGSMGLLNRDQTETMETIRMDGERLLGLVNELLELMKIESGREIYHIEPNDIKAIIDVAIRDFQENARRNNVRLDFESAEGLPAVLADFEKIRWVMNNLIGNALKFTSPGDAITISTRDDGKFVYVSVHDTGAGIPAEFQDKIFDKFIQAKAGGIEVSGTGLGLSVSREIVQSHGGTIRVNSTVGTGSTFTFSLPVAGGEEQA